jgi:hypothetical protein
MSISERKEIKDLFRYPLLEALSRRRTRRFPLGCSVAVGSMQHKSRHAPLSLSDLETAVLCWAGAGITGVAAADLSTRGMGNTFCNWLGRTVSNPCNSHTVKLFFTNDEGVFLYDPKKATKVVEIDTVPDRNKIMDYYQKDTRKLQDGRLVTAPEGVFSGQHWNINKAGTTLFMPIADLTELYINLLFGVFHGEGYQLFDDIQGKPAGLKKWIDQGALKGPQVPMSSFEDLLFKSSIAPSFMCVQNIQLVAEAMGLGSIPIAGYTSIIILGGTPISKGLGFRFVKGVDGKATCVGLDGFHEPLCPPYRSMNDAVDTFVAKKFGPAGLFDAAHQGINPFKDFKKSLSGYDLPSQQTIQIVKDYCNYVYDTYGRFPATQDTVVMPMWLQVHHLDTDWYDAYQVPGIVNETHRKHMDIWHR